jgi:hypothetical protein
LTGLTHQQERLQQEEDHVGYSGEDERFTHQLARPFDEVHHPDGSWSDRCYFFAHSPDGEFLVTNGYGNNPNQGAAMGYGKVAFADGRHWDLLVGRPITGDDRGDLHAGPMRWTCVEPLKRWRLQVGPNPSGIEWDLEYTPRAPMWELLPMHVEVDGRVVVDMFHMKETGLVSGWVEVAGERIELDSFPGGRDRTFGVRVADEIDFWLWLDAGFEDRAIEAWIIEAGDGAVQYVDGGITHTDGRLSQRFVSIEHTVTFDGDRKRPSEARLVLTDEGGTTYQVTATSLHQHVNAYYGQPLPQLEVQHLGGGEYFGFFAWDSSDPEELIALEGGAMSIDQLMSFELGDLRGHGIFEILSGGQGYPRYLANWPTMDMTPFRQRAAADRKERS